MGGGFSPGVAVWLVLGAAALLANLPFVNERLFALVALPGRVKSLGWRVLELCVFYGLSLGLGWWIEGRLGQVAPQRWEFYAVTAALFLVLAFPGFTWRYLVKHRRRSGPKSANA